MDWVVDILKQFGLIEGLFAVFFVGAHIVMYLLHKEATRILERENDRLFTENQRLLEKDDRNAARCDKLYDKIDEIMEGKRNG